jgi:molecular chaperone DnaK
LNPSGGLSGADIERLRREASTNAEADKIRIKLVGLRNDSDEVIYKSSRLLKIASEELDKESWEELSNAVKELKSLREGADALVLAKAISNVRSMIASVSKLVEVFETDEADAAAGFLNAISEGDPEDA